MRPDQMTRMSNACTVQLYRDVVDDVIKSVESRWLREGGDYKVLEQLKDLWLHRALKSCGVETEAPAMSFQMRQAKLRQQGQKDLDELFSLVGLSTGNDKSKSGSDENDESDEYMTSGSGYSEEEDDGLGSDLDDPELLSMVEKPVAKDHLLCLWGSRESKNSKKRGKMTFLDVFCGHFVLDSIPRVVKRGVLTLKR